jgi:uncharacterized damage-inducible protein DinB
VKQLHLCQRVALEMTLRAGEELTKAVRALPPEGLTWKPHAAARHALSLMGHCAVTNLVYACVLANAPLPFRSQAESDDAINRCDTLSKASASLQHSLTRLCDTLIALPADRLTEMVLLPDSERMPAALAMLVPANHMQYHVGQINYLQTLMGDQEYH